MSQVITFVPAGSGGTGPVQSLTGNDGLIVIPSASHTINVVGDGLTVNTSRTTATTLNIAIVGTQVDTAQTVDGSTITCGTVTVADNEIVIVQSRVIGAYESATNEAIGCVLTATFRKQGAADVALIQAVEQTALARSGGVGVLVDATYDTSGATVLVSVTGEALHTINWKAITTVLRQSAP